MKKEEESILDFGLFEVIVRWWKLVFDFVRMAEVFAYVHLCLVRQWYYDRRIFIEFISMTTLFDLYGSQDDSVVPVLVDVNYEWYMIVTLKVNATFITKFEWEICHIDLIASPKYTFL